MKLLALALGLLVSSSLAPAAGPVLLLSVDSSSSTPTSSGFALLAGQTYRVRAEGTFTYNMWVTDGTTFRADVEWSWNQSLKDGSWTESWPYPDSPDYFMDLLINNRGVDWRGTPDLTPGPNALFSSHTYSPSHIYETDIVGQGAPIDFMVYDNPYWYDNIGTLNISITEVPEPACLALVALGGLPLLRGRRQAA